MTILPTLMALALTVATTQPALENQPITLQLQLMDNVTHQAINPDDLQIAHEKLFHLMCFDQALENYIHIHPVISTTPGIWTVEATFPRTGNYKLWADITSKNGENIKTFTELAVGGNTLALPPVTSLEPVALAWDGNSGMKLDGVDHLTAASTAMVDLSFVRQDGSAPEITPYLGAMAHVAITNIAGDELIHTHPMVMNGMFMLHIEFPHAGDCFQSARMRAKRGATNR